MELFANLLIFVKFRSVPFHWINSKPPIRSDPVPGTGTELYWNFCPYKKKFKITASEAVSKPLKKKKKTESREFRDQQKQSQKKSRLVPFHSTTEEAEQIVSDVAQLVEPGSPTRDDQVSIPGVAIDFLKRRCAACRMFPV